MPRWRHLLARAGAWPAQRVIWGLVLVFSAWVVLDVLVLQLSSGLARSTYDAMVRLRMVAPAPDSRIVIVDIDEASLARMGREFGRWPWPRDTLATVLDHIEQQQPLAIVWDIVFSDPDRLNPGGDAAFDAAVRRSPRSHFPVVRLPEANDGASRITRQALPGLWVDTLPMADRSVTSATQTVALIPPVFPAVAAARLGYNNGYADRDGVLRRHRLAQALPDGSLIQSLPLSVLAALDPPALRERLATITPTGSTRGELIVWRARADAYPRIPFADLFARADGGTPAGPVPDLRGKVVLIGSTAPSLHDIHPTPLSPTHAGVDILATVLDNTLNRHAVTEMPRWLQALVAIALCAGIAVAIRFRSVASLDPTLLWVGLPASLVGISYLSLNGLPWFLDLQLSAGLAVVFLGLLRYWGNLRRDYWCSPPRGGGPMLVWPWQRQGPWTDAALDRLIDAVQRHAPGCRVVVLDVSASWPRKLRWPELACYAAIAGPRDELLAARAQLAPALQRLARRSAEPINVGAGLPRHQLATTTLMGWAGLQKSDTKNP